MLFSNVVVDEEKTKERRKNLENLYLNVYCNAGCNNKCVYSNACEGSIRMKSHEHWIFNDWSAKVGDNYDLTVDGTPVRILIIGKEGKSFSSSITKPSRWWSGINRHYNITYSTLKNLFSFWPKIDSDDCLLTMFSLTNTFSCAFRKHDGQTSGIPNSDVQRENCYRLRRKEIEILEPTVIIIQYDYLYAQDLCCDAVHCEGKVYYSKKSNCYIVESSHPSCRKHPWKDDLCNSISFLKRNGIVPSVIE